MGVGAPEGGAKVEPTTVYSSPLQSIQVRLRGVGACYLKGFWTVSR